MIKNPYTILGVTENASDEQIKAAYRELAKKYHPDNYQDSPLKDLANEKMQEINEAYDEIQRLRKEGRSYSSNGNTGSNSYNSNGGNTYTNYPDVRNYIRTGRLDDAQVILNGVPATKRDGEWYFLQGMIHYRKGWTDQAYSYFKTACDMNPENVEFRQVLLQMNNQRNYRTPEYNTTVNQNMGCSTCDMCSALCIADTCCECMGGDLCACC